MFHKILCPTDFSEGARHALHVAVGLAIENDAELVIVHVSQVPPLGLAEMTREAAALGAKRVATKAAVGVPSDQIVQMLNGDPEYDLVVMGTQGRTGLSRVLLGSVTEKVVRHAPCSVLAVHPHDGARSFERVLCPIDFSDSCRGAMMLARELVAPAGTITLLHVFDTRGYTGAPPLSDYLGETDEIGTRLLDDWASDLRRTTDVRVATRLEIGSPDERSLAVLDEEPSCDLVVVGSHGKTGMRRVLLGSVAEKIVRHAGCPVLVARARAS